MKKALYLVIILLTLLALLAFPAVGATVEAGRSTRRWWWYGLTRLI